MKSFFLSVNLLMFEAIFLDFSLFYFSSELLIMKIYPGMIECLKA